MIRAATISEHKTKMLTKAKVFLFLISIVCVQSRVNLAQKIFDVKENREANQTLQDRLEDVEISESSTVNMKRDIPLNSSSEEATKIAVKLLTDAIEKILTKSIQIQNSQNIIQKVQSGSSKQEKTGTSETEILNHGQVSNNLNVHEVSGTDNADKSNYIWSSAVQNLASQLGQTKSALQSQKIESNVANSASQTPYSGYTSSQIQNNSGQNKDQNSWSTLTTAQVHQINDQASQSDNQMNWNSAQSLQQNQIQSNSAEASQESTQENTGSKMQDYQVVQVSHIFPQISAAQTQQKLGSFNQMSSQKQNLDQSSQVTTNALPSSIAQNGWGGIQTVQQAEALQGSNYQHNYGQAETNLNGALSNWHQQNRGMPNLISHTNVLGAQQSFAAQDNWNGIQANTENQVQSNNAQLQVNQASHDSVVQSTTSGNNENQVQQVSQSYPETSASQSEQNLEALDQISSSKVQDSVQLAQTNLNNAHGYQNQVQATDNSFVNSGWDGTQTTQTESNWNGAVINWNQNAGVSNQATESNVYNSNQHAAVTNWQQQNVGISNANTQTNVLDMQQYGQASQETNSQQSAAQTGINWNGAVTNWHLQNSGVSNQDTQSNVQNSIQQAAVTNTETDVLDAQNLQYDHVSQEGNSLQNAAQTETYWNDGVLNNWQHQITRASSEDTQSKVQQNTDELNHSNSVHTTHQDQISQQNSNSGHSGSLSSLTGAAANWQKEANSENVHQNVQAAIYNNIRYKNNQVAIQRAKYHFATRIIDNINGNYQERNEHRKEGKVTGFYSYDDGNIFRTVSYVADDKGYRVLSDDIEPSRKTTTNLDGTAEVKSYNNGISTEYAIRGDHTGGYKETVVARGDIQEVQ